MEDRPPADPGSVVASDARTLTFLDRRQYHPGHVLVMPRRHVPDLRAADDATAVAVMVAVARAARTVDQAFPGDGLTSGTRRAPGRRRRCRTCTSTCTRAPERLGGALVRRRAFAHPEGMLPLSDRLAVTRTELANERTLLSYGRTGLALMAAGVGVAELFTTRALVVAGWALVPTGALVLASGMIRFRRTRKALRALVAPVG